MPLMRLFGLEINIARAAQKQALPMRTVISSPWSTMFDARTNLYGGSGDEGGRFHVSAGAGPLSLYDGEWVWMRSRSTYGRTYQS